MKQTTAQNSSSTYSINICSSVTEIMPAEWNALLAPADSPFMEWQWYAALEISGSISVENGWMGMHIAVRKDKRLVALAPLYMKMHSWGELVFDHNWQNIAQQLGVRYFPKLVGMIPTTPCSGYRFLIAHEENQQHLHKIILGVIDAIGKTWDVRTVAFNFVGCAMQKELSEHEFYTWSHPGFSWQNQSFRNFEDYQQQFTKNQRRNIRRERGMLAAHGLQTEIIDASQLPRRYFQLMHRYYDSTNKKFGMFAAHFLNEKFFTDIAHYYAHRILFSCCFKQSEVSLPHCERTPIAMAMLIQKNDMLYGRYWGEADGESRAGMVHFNVCYYTPIEWAIRHKISYFDPGIGGEHKLRRGFVADEKHTLLRFTDEKLQYILAHHHKEINDMTEDYTAALNQHRPIKH